MLNLNATLKKKAIIISIDHMPSLNAKVAIGVCVAVAGLSLLSRGGRSAATSTSRDAIDRLVRQAARFHVQGNQDANPLIALVHYNYATAYAKLAKSLASKDNVRIDSLKISEVIYVCEQAEQSKIKEIAALAPVLKPDGAFALATGWI